MCNKIVLQPDVAYPTQDDKQRSELLQKLFFNNHIADAQRRLLQDDSTLYFVLDKGNHAKLPCALIDEITIQPRANEMERQNVLSALAFYREMANFLQSGLPQMPYPLQPNPAKTNRKQV